MNRSAERQSDASASAETEQLRKMFAFEIAPWMRQNLAGFWGEGEWLDREFSGTAIRRRELRRLRELGAEGRAELGLRLRQTDMHRIEKYPVHRLSETLRWVVEKRERQAASPPSHWCRQVLLVVWLALDGEAGNTEPRVTSLQSLVVDHERESEPAPADPAKFDAYFEGRPFRGEWGWHRPDPDRDRGEFLRLMRAAELAWAVLSDERKGGPVVLKQADRAGMRLPVPVKELIKVHGWPLSRSTLDRARKDAENPLWHEKRRGEVYVDVREVVRRWPDLRRHEKLLKALVAWFPRGLADAETRRS